MAAFLMTLGAAAGQTAPASDTAPAPGSATASEVSPDPGLASEPAAKSGKRVFGVLPNYRTTDVNGEFEPISAKEKFSIAAHDSYDRGDFMLSFALGGLGMIEQSNQSFGQGVKGYAHYTVTSYADIVTGNLLTEGLFPAVLKQDPRYFRQGTGTFKSRLGHSLVQILRTRSDSGKYQFNYCEFAGNAISTALSNAWEPDSRDARSNTIKFAMQIGIDTISNVLKEFSPDIMAKIFHRKQ